MFNKTLHVHQVSSTRLVPYEKTIHEHKAPTDESIKLYGELVEKAYKSLLDTFTVETNSIKVHCRVWHNAMTDIKKCGFVFDINGKTIKDVVDIEHVMKTRQEIFSSVAKSIANTLTNEITKDAEFTNYIFASRGIP